MAIKIDLLPGYVGLRRWFKRLALVAAALIAATGAMLYALYYKGQQELATVEANLSNIEPWAQKTEAAKAAAQTAVNEAAPVRAAVDFMVDASKTGAQRAALLDLVRKYIYRGAVISSINIADGQTVKLNATMRSPDEYGQFVTDLRQGAAQTGGPLFSQLPIANGVPGFPPPLPNDATQPAQGRQNPGPITPQQPTIIVLPLQISASGPLAKPITVPDRADAASGSGSGGGGGAAGSGGSSSSSGSSSSGSSSSGSSSSGSSSSGSSSSGSSSSGSSSSGSSSGYPSRPGSSSSSPQ